MNGKRLAVVAVAALTAVLLIYGVAQRNKAPSFSAAAGAGSSAVEQGPAPLFSGTTLDGQQLTLEEYRGRPVVLNFWGSWCTWCRREAPDLAAFARKHPDVAVIGVDVGDEQAGAQAFVTEFGIPFPSVYDPEGKIAAQYGVEGYPTTVFVDADLQVKAVIPGATDGAGFESRLSTIL